MEGHRAGGRVVRRLLLVTLVVTVTLGVTNLPASAQPGSVTPPAAGVANGAFYAVWDHYCGCYVYLSAAPMELTGSVPSLGGPAPGGATLGWWFSSLTNNTTPSASGVPFSGWSNNGYTFSGSCTITATLDAPLAPVAVYTVALAATCAVTEAGVPLTWTLTVNGAQETPAVGYQGVYQLS